MVERLLSERQLLERCCRGSESAIAELVRRHERRAYAVAYRLLLDRSAAQDVTQEAFIRALSRLSQFDKSRPFWPWLRRIVVNLALNECRRKETDRRARAELAEAVAQDPPGHSSSSFEVRDAVRRALEQLPPELRAVIGLRVCEELSYREIAEALNIPIGTVMSRLARARRLLQDQLRELVESD